MLSLTFLFKLTFVNFHAYFYKLFYLIVGTLNLVVLFVKGFLRSNGHLLVKASNKKYKE